MYLNELLKKSNIRLPSKKEEKWKFSPLNRYLNKQYKQVEYEEEEDLLSCPNEFYIHLQDGHLLQEHLPLSAHIKRRPFFYEEKTNPFSNLVFNSCESSFELIISEDAKINIYLVYSKDSFTFSSLNIILKEGVKAEIFYNFKGGKTSFISHSCHIKLYPYAKLFISQEQNLHKDAVLIYENYFHLEERSDVEAFYLLNEADYMHNFIFCDLHFKSEINISSLLLSKEDQQFIFSCDINHLSSMSKSSIFSKQVLKDKSVCVFDANTQIFKDTKQCVASQSTHALLLDEKAQIHSKPHLEIYTDDLTASHGSTVGQLDENALSYLNSRGISKKRATQMLIQAFIKEPLERINILEHKKKILLCIGDADEHL